MALQKLEVSSVGNAGDLTRARVDLSTKRTDTAGAVAPKAARYLRHRLCQRWEITSAPLAIASAPLAKQLRSHSPFGLLRCLHSSSARAGNGFFIRRAGRRRPPAERPTLCPPPREGQCTGKRGCSEIAPLPKPSTAGPGSARSAPCAPGSWPCRCTGPRPSRARLQRRTASSASTTTSRTATRRGRGPRGWTSACARSPRSAWRRSQRMAPASWCWRASSGCYWGWRCPRTARCRTLGTVSARCPSKKCPFLRSRFPLAPTHTLVQYLAPFFGGKVARLSRASLSQPCGAALDRS